MSFVKDLFTPSSPDKGRRHFLVAFFVGIIAGIVSAFVKWGAEHPFPPRSGVDTGWTSDAVCKALNWSAENTPSEAYAALPELFNSAEKIGAAGFDCQRAFLNPPYIFLRKFMDIQDPYAPFFSFADSSFHWIGVTHMIFSLCFAIAYCIWVEIFPKFKMWQGIFAALVADVCVHYITFPALGLAPMPWEWPLFEHISELVGHMFWFWTIEVIRRDLRNRITGEPDAEIPITANR